MQRIKNRRFMFSPQSGELILGRQYKGRQLFSSHAEEHGSSGAAAPFDSFLRGWIGTGKEYPQGVIHFAPAIDSRNVELFNRAFDALEMFAENGAMGSTVIRGFGEQWEQPLQNIIPSLERSARMSEFEARPIELTATDTAGKVKEITEHLEQGVKDLFESERYQNYLKAMSKFHDYSLNNTLLIMMQKPDASLVAGYGKWRDEFERHVKHGEKGIKILAPAPYTIKKEIEKIDQDTGRPVMGADGKPVMEQQEIKIPAFKVVSIFDVSQTEGKEIPDIAADRLTGSVEQYEDFFRALELTSPVPVGFEQIESGAHGYYHLEDKRIALNEGESELQTIKTLIHEIAHAKLHDIDLNAPEQQESRPTRRTREVEAESIAYTVCQHFGLDTSDYSFGYVAGWSSDKDIKELKASLETIRTAASELITEIDGHFTELQQQRPVMESIDTQRQQAAEAAADTPEKIGADLFELMREHDPAFMQRYEDRREEQIAATVNSLKNSLNDTLAIEAVLIGIKEDGATEEIRNRAAALTDRIDAFEEKNNTYSIYQIKGGEATRDYRFEPLDRLRATGHSIDRANYDLVYSAPLSPLDTLERIYQRFNTDHPADFEGHSLSVSDIVVLRQGDKETAHYCDSFGFTEVPEFLQQEQIAQRWNGMDGLINDRPFMPDATPNAQANALIDYAERDGQRLGNAERGLIIRYHEALQDLPKTVALVNELCEAGFEQQNGYLNYLVKQRIDAEITAAEQERGSDQPLPPSLDPAVQPVVTILWSESDKLREGEQMPLARADALFKALDDEKRSEREKPGYTGGWYDKTKFRIDFTFQGERDNYEGRQGFGDGDGSLIEHIKAYHEYYAQNESWKNTVLHNEGAEAWEKDKAEREMILNDFIPYLDLHRNLYEMEQTAAQPLETNDHLTPEQTAYFNAVFAHVDACRGMLNQGHYDLPELPGFEEYTRQAAETESYKAHVREEIAQEAAAAGMTVDEYAANGYEAAPAPELSSIADETEMDIDEILDEYPISVEINGEWHTFPNAEAAEEALAKADELTALERQSVEIAKGYEGLPLSKKIAVIAQTFGCNSGTIETSPCTGKWRGTSDISIRFDNGASLFIGNHRTPQAKTVRIQTEYVNSALTQFNPQIVAAAKAAAIDALMKREVKDNAIAAEKGLKPYTLLNVELHDGADGKSGYLGWYYVTLAVDGKIHAHMETGLNHDIANGKVSETPAREDYFTAGTLKEADVDYVFNNVGFSSTSDLYSLPISDAVRDRAEKALAEREKARLAVEVLDTPQNTQAAVRYYPINEAAARRAQDANSYRDYVPGSATAEYRAAVDRAAELAQAQKKRVDPMYHDKIDGLLDTYARKLAENMNNRYAIEGRVPSVLVAGGSNFPTGKKEKQNAARHRNMEDWQDIQGLLDKIRSIGMGGISADDPQAVAMLEAKLESLVQSQETMKAVNAYYRRHGTLEGCTLLPPEQLAELKKDMAQSWHLDKSRPFQSYALSNNNAEIRRTRERIESLKQHGQRGYAEWEFDGGRVEANKEANRLQIFFDDKPDSDTRDELKANGFRWAPSAGAWQRQLNANAYRAADNISCIQPATGERPTELQRKAQRADTAQEQPEQQKELAPDDYLTDEKIQTPRGTFRLTSLSVEQMKEAGYSFHHQSDDGRHYIMTSNNTAFAVAVEQPLEQAQPENYLKAAEMSTEQNYNMIDQQINNTPSVDELEEKAKRGELVSLSALAAAVKAEDGRTPKRDAPGKKPSIRAQLQASKAQAAKQPKKEQEAKRSIRQALEME